MIVWGGSAGPAEVPAADGAAYDPSTRTWRTVAEAPLAPRYAHSAVWTGTRMIVWGGTAESEIGGHSYGDGASYDPVTDTWRSIAAAPVGRSHHSAVWTGSEMIAWSGTTGIERGEDDGFQFPRDGAAYDPVSDSWREVGAAPTDGLTGQSAVWTGDRMIVWGGGPGGPIRLAGGFAYDPRADEWSVIPDAPITGRIAHSAVWTGQEMFVWGGTEGAPQPFGDGAYYHPPTGAWRALPTMEAPARFSHSAVWTGFGMLVWGGLASYDDPPSNEGFAHAFRPTTADPDEAVLQLLENHFASGQRTACSWTSERAINTLGDEEARRIDAEVARRGRNIWAPGTGRWWIGDAHVAAEMFGGGEILRPDESYFWQVRYDADFAGGAWSAREIRRFVTAAGNEVWVEDRTIAAFPGDCPPHE